MDGESKRSHNRLGVILQNQPSEPENLPLDYLREITNNFCDEHLLGKGGFGIVYKGVKQNGDMIAVKKLTLTTPEIQDRQFENEVRHLMGLKHPNIVQLVGYCTETQKIPLLYKGKYICAEESERLICLEYLPKGSLREHLSDEKSGLDWDTRYRIIQGICYGLHYLHEEWNVNTPIIHMDLKPPNILLDDNMVPKIADFGLSRLFGEEQTRTCTASRDGTLGYMAPEYINRGVITKKLDIFSLGVIIIEIMTGRKDYPYETETSSQKFTELVLKNWRNRLENASRYAFLETDCQQIRRCIEIGLACVKVDWEERPTTCQIIKLLHGLEGAEYNNERLRTGRSSSPVAAGFWDEATMEPGSSFSEAAEDDPLPGLEGLRITFESSPGREIQASRYPTAGEDSATAGEQQSLMPPPRPGSSKGPSSVVEHFTLEALQAATDSFSDERRIGFGSFGSVYHGTPLSGREVAIKRAEDLAKPSIWARRSDRETAFNSEITALALALANHKNIVCLLGCCADSGECVLVYEFMANGTLHDQLHSGNPLAPPVASWRGRLTIALDAARGIEYMHVYAVPRIIHRDIKSANILLDDLWTAKIACDDGDCGSVVYIDPEYYRLQRLTKKSDVYSFGVVLLELLSGCKAIQRFEGSGTPKNVVDVAVPHIEVDREHPVLDARLPLPTPEEMEAVTNVWYLAADCVRPAGRDRPTMSEVVSVLERAVVGPVAAGFGGEATMKEPGSSFFEAAEDDPLRRMIHCQAYYPSWPSFNFPLPTKQSGAVE